MQESKQANKNLCSRLPKTDFHCLFPSLRGDFQHFAAFSWSMLVVRMCGKITLQTMLKLLKIIDVYFLALCITYIETRSADKLRKRSNAGPSTKYPKNGPYKNVIIHWFDILRYQYWCSQCLFAFGEQSVSIYDCAHNTKWMYHRKMIKYWKTQRWFLITGNDLSKQFQHYSHIEFVIQRWGIFVLKNNRWLH